MEAEGRLTHPHVELHRLAVHAHLLGEVVAVDGGGKAVVEAVVHQAHQEGRLAHPGCGGHATSRTLSKELKNRISEKKFNSDSFIQGERSKTDQFV